MNNHNLFKIYPERPISGILPNMQRIIEPMQLELNESEFIRCMNYGNVYAVVDGKEIKVTRLDYKSALKLFVSNKKNIIPYKEEKDEEIIVESDIEKAPEEIINEAEELDISDDSVEEEKEILDKESNDDQISVPEENKNETNPEHINNQMNKNQSSSNHKYKGSRRR